MNITPSQIIEYLFCPRFTYFEHVLKIPQYEERHYKVNKGRNIHDLKMIRNKEYLRKKIGVVEKYQDEYLTNNLLRGKVDEVLELADGTMAPLDYKFAQYKDRVYDTYKTQLYCYAVLIEENFKRSVIKGFLVYVRSKNKLIEVPISEGEKTKVKNVAKMIIEIISGNYFPKATKFKKRCVSCTYRNICIK
ncbi:MAG: CRISPR-associated protein Cas4 [Bacteroidetes bacterium]|nr:MAG: CRISPR-associated protein Cas4 [Bacteroidota bacterium]